MVTVFDLVTGETETFTSPESAPRRAASRSEEAPRVLPRLQEHTFTEPAQPQPLPLAVAQLDVEVFVRMMEEG